MNNIRHHGEMQSLIYLATPVDLHTVAEAVSARVPRANPIEILPILTPLGGLIQNGNFEEFVTIIASIGEFGAYTEEDEAYWLSRYSKINNITNRLERIKIKNVSQIIYKLDELFNKTSPSKPYTKDIEDEDIETFLLRLQDAEEQEAYLERLRSREYDTLIKYATAFRYAYECELLEKTINYFKLLKNEELDEKELKELGVTEIPQALISDAAAMIIYSFTESRDEAHEKLTELYDHPVDIEYIRKFAARYVPEPLSLLSNHPLAAMAGSITDGVVNGDSIKEISYSLVKTVLSKNIKARLALEGYEVFTLGLEHQEKKREYDEQQRQLEKRKPLEALSKENLNPFQTINSSSDDIAPSRLNLFTEPVQALSQDDFQEAPPGAELFNKNFTAEISQLKLIDTTLDVQGGNHSATILVDNDKTLELHFSQENEGYQLRGLSQDYAVVQHDGRIHYLEKDIELYTPSYTAETAPLKLLNTTLDPVGGNHSATISVQDGKTLTLSFSEENDGHRLRSISEDYAAVEKDGVIHYLEKESAPVSYVETFDFYCDSPDSDICLPEDMRESEVTEPFQRDSLITDIGEEEQAKDPFIETLIKNNPDRFPPDIKDSIRLYEQKSTLQPDENGSDVLSPQETLDGYPYENHYEYEEYKNYDFYQSSVSNTPKETNNIAIAHHHYHTVTTIGGEPYALSPEMQLALSDYEFEQRLKKLQWDENNRSMA